MTERGKDEYEAVMGWREADKNSRRRRERRSERELLGVLASSPVSINESTDSIRTSRRAIDGLRCWEYRASNCKSQAFCRSGSRVPKVKGRHETD